VHVLIGCPRVLRRRLYFAGVQIGASFDSVASASGSVVDCCLEQVAVQYLLEL
jgi:hypothetical protein